VTDERLQDYLDGRLDDDERAEVEARLGEDPELARRVEAWREAGRALRDDPAELSPGFYARARDRFEQTAGGPRGFRLLSWETAGLAAAVVLVAALFGPELMRGRDTGHPSLAPAVAELELPPPAAASPEVPMEAETPAPSAGRVGEKKMRADLEEAAPDEDRPAHGDFAPAPEPAAAQQAAPQRRAKSAPPAPREAREESFAKAEPLDSQGLADAMDHDAARAPEMAGAAESRAKGRGGAAPIVVPLAADPRLPHGLRVVEDAVERADWLAGPLARLSAEARDGRLVLVGDDGGADCGSLTVRRVGESYRVRLARPGAAAGCGLVLPRDGLAVALEE